MRDRASLIATSTALSSRTIFISSVRPWIGGQRELPLPLFNAARWIFRRRIKLQRASHSGNAISWARGDQSGSAAERALPPAQAPADQDAGERREHPAELPVPSDDPRLCASTLASLPQGMLAARWSRNHAPRRRSNSVKAATDAHAKAMLAKGRATVAVSRAEGARGIKTEEVLEGIERCIDRIEIIVDLGIKTEEVLEGIERRLSRLRRR